ncbi:hypothetical protein D1BOALGB6SA_7401 [Olavius sp. associated proteobacterium Delta 1]|nr:hypothetical protein D1BOALGB6SA_7401 [Olavius sp. associated proteobacterium Delta 1]
MPIKTLASKAQDQRGYMQGKTENNRQTPDYQNLCIIDRISEVSISS